jgi:mannitol/fructose-specific phosphotransferase system IIA component
MSSFTDLTGCNKIKNEHTMETQDNTLIFQKGDRLTNGYFTGEAYLKLLLARDSNNDFVMGNVTFQPGGQNQLAYASKGTGFNNYRRRRLISGKRQTSASNKKR